MERMSVRTEQGVTTPLQRVRDAAVTLLDTIDKAIEAQPRDLEDQMARIREALLTNYAPEGIRSVPRRGTSNGSKASAGEFRCDKCDRAFKNEAGLKIHVGRTHKRRRRRSEDTPTTPERSDETRSNPSGVVFTDV